MKSVKVAVIGAVVLCVLLLGYQNCAKTKFNDPDTRHSAIALGLCKVCEDAAGAGLACRIDTDHNFSQCFYESCNPGYKHDESNHTCTPVVCEVGSQANCEVEHGQGFMACANNGEGYANCSATQCEDGYALEGGNCVSIPQACDPGSHRDCGTVSTHGTEICNEAGSAYGTCEFGDCKPGYNKQGETCVINICEPSTITSCTVGAGNGFQTCNSNGSGWGVCELNACQAGYTLKDGACVVQVCTPGSKTVCEFDHGTGEKTCNVDGLGWGVCDHQGCANGFYLEDQECKQQKCTPSSQETCTGQSGTGVMYCYENGRGHGPCNLTTCDQGFKLKNNHCVGENTCDDGETFTCTEQNGTGIRACKNDHTIGPCVLTACNSDYELTVQGNSTVCKKKK